MRVVLLPADQGACGHYRLTWPGMAVHREGREDLTVTLVEPGRVQMRTTRGVLGPVRFEVRGLPDVGPGDVVVMQRVGSEAGVRLIQHLQERGVAVVLDADDALWAIEEENSSFRAWNGRPHHWKWMDEAARLADLVTVTTPYLAQRYGREHGRVEVIPNFLPVATLATDEDLARRRARRAAGTVHVGWSGTLASHPNDLPVAHPAVHTARQVGAEVHVLGDGRGVAEAWGLPREQIAVHGGVPLEQYHAALDVLDLGLVPLADNRFNRAKSWLKALEYAGRGIPSMVSPTPANRALSEWLLHVQVIETPYLWPVSMVEVLDSEPSDWTYASHLLRDAVAEHLTIEGNVALWRNAWTRAAERRANLTSVRSGA